jgi:hypothetical protein
MEPAAQDLFPYLQRLEQKVDAIDARLQARSAHAADDDRTAMLELLELIARSPTDGPGAGGWFMRLASNKAAAKGLVEQLTGKALVDIPQETPEHWPQ